MASIVTEKQSIAHHNYSLLAMHGIEGKHEVATLSFLSKIVCDFRNNAILQKSSTAYQKIQMLRQRRESYHSLAT